MINSYRLAKAAQDDLREIKCYSRTAWGEQQTQYYLSEIKECLENLVINPELGKTRDDIFKGLRSFVVAKHVVFYRISGADIEVARILHGKMDVHSRFKND